MYKMENNTIYRYSLHGSWSDMTINCAMQLLVTCVHTAVCIQAALLAVQIRAGIIFSMSPTCNHGSSAKKPVTCDNSCKHHPHNRLLRWLRKDLHKRSPWCHTTQHYHMTQPPLASPPSVPCSVVSLTDPDDWSSLASWLSPLLGPLSHTTCLCLKDLLTVRGEEGGGSYIGGRRQAFVDVN